jgi:DNA-binding protein HU-beta
VAIFRAPYSPQSSGGRARGSAGALSGNKGRPCDRPGKGAGMNKSELIEKVAQRSNHTKADVTRVLDALLATITDSMKRGEKVSLTGFGTFEVRERAARTVPNPQTGAPVNVKKGKTPAFKVGKSLKDSVGS